MAARYGKSPSGNPLTKYVNLFQTPEERREKYAYARSMGVPVAHAQAMRDRRWTTIQKNISAFGMMGLLKQP